MAELNIEERVANMERQLFGLSYKEAKPIYDCMMEVVKNMDGKPEVKIHYVEANQQLLTKLECVLGIKGPYTL